MAARCRDEGSDDSHEVIVHISGVTEGRRRSRHNSRNLGVISASRLADGRLLTSWFVCWKEGSCTWSLSATILERAPLSNTTWNANLAKPVINSLGWQCLTTESAFCVNRLIASKLLYGLTTTSADCVSGKTE